MATVVRLEMYRRRLIERVVYRATIRIGYPEIRRIIVNVRAING